MVPTADRQKATVLVRIGFEELDPRILPDMGVKVTFLRDDGSGAARPRGAAGDARAEGRGPDRQRPDSFVFVVDAATPSSGAP